MNRALLSVLAPMVACAPKHVPAHLRVAPMTEEAEVLPPTTLAEAITQLTAGDPLVRRPVAQDRNWWGTTPDMAPIVAWSEAVAAGPPSSSTLDTLELTWPGSVAVPLARGARLAQLEVDLPSTPPDESGDRALVVWLGSLTVAPRPGPSDVRLPLGWLGADRTAQRAGLLYVMEQSVLLGWLHGPTIPLEPVEAAMVDGTFDRLRARPEGALIVARAETAQNAAAALDARQFLHDATHLALARVAADHPVQQRKVQQQSQELATSLGLTDGANPLPPLLSSAWQGFVADAHSDASTGLALATLAAQRLSGALDAEEPNSLARVQTLHQAARWDAAVEPVAWAWRLIAAKDALDQLGVSVSDQRSTPAFPLVADIIIGERGGRVPLSLLLQQRVGPAASLAITRGLGAPDGTEADEALGALRAHIQTLCEASPAAGIPEEWNASIQRICKD